MKKVIFVFIAFCCYFIEAQTVYLPNIGTKWHYNFARNAPYNDTVNSTITYIRDSIDNTGQKIKILKCDRIYSMFDVGGISKYMFIKQRNDSVWFFNTYYPTTWELFINFNATLGQVWYYDFVSYPSFSYTEYSVKVLALGTTTINNIPIKYMDVRYVIGLGFTTYEVYTSRIYERFGDIRYLFQLFNKDKRAPNLTRDSVISLLCYEDNNIGIHQFTNKSCDFQNMVSLSEHTQLNQFIKVFPNPASNKIYIEANYNIKINQISISNALGQIVLTLLNNENKQAIDITNLSPGIYFLKAENEKGKSVFKFIKE